MSSGFKGFVNPNQPNSIHYGNTPKKNGEPRASTTKVAKPGQPIELTEREFQKMKKKGLASKLLVKTLPTVVGGEAPDDDASAQPGQEGVDGLPDIDDKTTKAVLSDTLDRLGIEHDKNLNRGDLYTLVSDAYDKLAEE